MIDAGWCRQYKKCVVVEPSRFAHFPSFSFAFMVNFLFAEFIFRSSPFLLSLGLPLFLSLHLLELFPWIDACIFPSASISFRDGSPYSIIEYISQWGHYLDARWLGTMRIVDDQPSVYDHWLNSSIPRLQLGWSSGFNMVELELGALGEGVGS